MENLPIKTKKINKKLFLTDASLYCRLAENSNARPVLLNHNQLLSERLETVQCEMHFFGVIFNFSRVFLISASKNPAHSSSGGLQWLTFGPGNQERLSSFNHTHEDFLKNKINQYPPLKVNSQNFTLIETVIQPQTLSNHLCRSSAPECQWPGIARFKTGAGG